MEVGSGRVGIGGIGDRTLFFNDTGATGIETMAYTLALHDAVRISCRGYMQVEGWYMG